MNKKEYYVSPNNITTFELIEEYLYRGSSNVYNRSTKFTPFQGALLFNVIKYMARTKKSLDDTSDFNKAIDYANAYRDSQYNLDFQHVGDEFHTKVLPFILSGDELQARSNFNEWRDKFEKQYILGDVNE